MSEGPRLRESFRREPHPLPDGWNWTWQNEVFTFKGGAQPPASQFMDHSAAGNIRFVQIRDYYSSDHLTYVPDLPNLRKCGASDVMIARYGASLGRICRGIEGAYNVALVKVSPIPPTENDFLFYLLQSEYFQAPMQGQGARSAQAGFNREGLKNILLPLPRPGEQRAIAEVLSALDERIAANAKVAQTSLALASSIFLDSIARVPFSDHTFNELADIGGGGTPRTDTPEFWDGEVPWATPTDITALTGPYLESTPRKISDLGLASCSSPLYPAGSILMTSR
ncbi:MAG TPA: restriction endonuclease subunit S, partial [Geobacterales bacterium]|nr:restriction endonuclease subunit S [Geobacterales bacterium]